MYFRLIRQDILRSKAVSLITTLFVAASAMLVSLAAILIVHLTGSLDALMTEAKAPHYMQMHAGDLDVARLEAFSERNHNIEALQVVPFLNIDGARITIGEHTLADSVQDNGVSVQNGQFDFLLDLDGKIVAPSDGELYVPVSYMKPYQLEVGDQAVIGGRPFVVAGFLRDAAMNSSLAGSKRFLVSDRDFEALKPLGNMEYLIEFRLKDPSKLGELEKAYLAAGLEMNGPTVTYALFRLMNAISDGMMIGVLLLVSLLVAAIAFMCIRFTLLAKLEDDYREIGVMKAIGLRLTDIKKIYLAKYAAIAAVGAALGYALSFAFQGMLLRNIRLYMGGGEHAALATAAGAIGILLVYAAITTYVNRVLNRCRKISAVEALRFGTSPETAGGGRWFTLSGNRWLSANILLGVKDVLSRKKLYATMLAVLVLSTFILIVPQNLYHTISSRSFIGHMGIGSYDLRIQVSGSVDQVAAKVAGITEALGDDPAVSRMAVLITKAFTAITKDGTEQNIKVELGDHSIFPIAYVKGRAPARNDEIALSSILADELGTAVGDSLTLQVAGGEKVMTVTGIYSDITNGGKTAKATFPTDAQDMLWTVICIKLTEPSLVKAKVGEYAGKFAYAKISDIDEYVAQTFGSTMASVQTASRVAIVVAVALVVLITLLFMKMLVARDRYQIAVMKAFGYTHADIEVQYLSRTLLVLIIGMALGTLLANTLGELLAGMVIASFGAAAFHFSVDPMSAYVFSPILMTGSVLLAAWAGISGAGRIRISDNIKE